MKLQRWIGALLALCMVLLLMPAAVNASETDSTPMYRLYNPNSGEHFYTGSVEEREILVDAGWNYEGVAWNAPVSGGTPVYRVYNPNSGDHHYTMDKAEIDMLRGEGWQYEGVCWNSAAEGSAQYRLWNPNADLGSHHYTSSVEERDDLVKLGWILEGIGWYGVLSTGSGSDEHTHSYTAKVTKEATCVSEGVRTYTCSCGDTYTESIPKTDAHSWGEWVTTKEPTTSSTGTAERSCMTFGCGVTETKTLPMLDSEESHVHSWGEWVTVKEPTTSSTGTAERSCTILGCGVTETKTLPMLDSEESHVHSWSEWVVVEPTCTASGYKYRTCSGCDAKETADGSPAVDHSYSLSENKDGMNIYTCSKCGNSYTISEVDDFLMKHGYRDYDESMAPPEVIDTYSKDGESAYILCRQSSEDVGRYYQAVLAKDGNFTNGVLFGQSYLIEEDDEEVKINDIYDSDYKRGYNVTGTYYYKVRTVVLENGSYIYGPWSEVGTFSCLDFSCKLENKEPQYSYDFYFVDNLGTDVYTSTGKALYIKTDNPDPESIRLTLNGENILRSVSGYEDVNFLNPDDVYEEMRKVQGGYLCTVYLGEAGNERDELSERILLDKAGSYTIEVWEATFEGYTIAEEFQLNVLLLQEEYSKWYNSVISTQTDSSMNPKEKMDAIVEYLTNGQFRYFVTDGERYLTLAAEPNYPELVAKRWNSFISPNRLYTFAYMIGGFEEIHNCYGDYPAYSDEWREWHAYIYVVYEGETYYYMACPPSSTGKIDEITMIDFSNTSQFTKIG